MKKVPVKLKQTKKVKAFNEVLARVTYLKNRGKRELVDQLLEAGYDSMSKTYSPDAIFEELLRVKKELEEK